MAGQAQFTHIHCSSRFDRSAASLEADMDDWMAHSSLITVTEVRRDQKAATLREAGWAHYNSPLGNNADVCAIAWKTSTWHRKDAFVRKLSSVRYVRALANKPGPPTYACNAVLKHVVTDQTLLVSVTHMPAHLEGHWAHPGTDAWRARKQAYTDAMHGWSNLVLALERRYRPAGVLVVADWNLNLKEQWVRDYMAGHWTKAGLRRAWVHFPTAGGSLGGNRIIDGSYYGGLSVTGGPDLMPRVRSSDHRPYSESFKMVGGLKLGSVTAADPATGNLGKGVEWWGFGDYAFDEMFEKVSVTEEGTVVTFDFDTPPY
jgi:hypothetical protein